MFAVDTLEGMLAIIKKRIDSGEWWVFINANLQENTFISHIERTYYPEGEPAKDFDLLCGPIPELGFPLVAFFLARKTRLPVEKLEAEVEAIGNTGMDLSRKDIIGFSAADGAAMIWLNQKIKP